VQGYFYFLSPFLSPIVHSLSVEISHSSTLVFLNGKLSRYRTDTSRKDAKISQHSRLQEGARNGVKELAFKESQRNSATTTTTTTTINCNKTRLIKFIDISVVWTHLVVSEDFFGDAILGLHQKQSRRLERTMAP